MCGTVARVEPANRPGKKPEALAALLALLEEELQPDADAEHRPARIDALAQRVGERLRARRGGAPRGRPPR